MSDQQFLPYAKQNISTEDLEAVKQALAQPIITRGSLVSNFESAIASELFLLLENHLKRAAPFAA